jgi:hypothetical protein
MSIETEYQGHDFPAPRHATSRCFGCDETWSKVIARTDKCPGLRVSYILACVAADAHQIT